MKKIKKLADFVLKYGILTWMAAALVWFVIVSTLRNGWSCDEGFYLMGYLRGQQIGNRATATEFHYIVRTLCKNFPDDNIMVYRYLRLVLNSFALVLFALSSYNWLFKIRGLKLSRWLYYPVVMLSGAMMYTFASPTISYDHLQSSFYLLIFSLLFVGVTVNLKIAKSFSFVLIGFFVWFAFTNYPPSGLCLGVVLLCWIVSQFGKKTWEPISFMMLGFAAAILYYHFAIHNLFDYLNGMYSVIVKTFTEQSMSRHDSRHLVFGILKTLGSLAVIGIPLLLMFFLLIKKLHLNSIVKWSIVLSFCVFLLCKPLAMSLAYKLQSRTILFVVIIVLAQALSEIRNTEMWKTIWSKESFVLLMLMLIPFAGVFGTNQLIWAKSMVFAPFWIVACFFLIARINRNMVEILVLLCMVLFVDYFYLGSFRRYHYNYTPRSSKYELKGIERPQSILVGQYESEFFRDICDTLKMNGCKPGDVYAAFGEFQMVVYFAGGFVSGNMPYHWWQYEDFEKERPRAFLLFKREENAEIEYFSRANWDFPAAYHRMEMRQMSENMGDELRTVIYIRDDNLENDER